MTDEEQRYMRGMVEDTSSSIDNPRSAIDICTREKVESVSMSLGFQQCEYSGWHDTSRKLAVCATGMELFWRLSYPWTCALFALVAVQAQYAASVLQSAYTAGDDVRCGTSHLRECASESE